ncbi:MAG: ATP-binding protein [Sedimentibacter sp.]
MIRSEEMQEIAREEDLNSFSSNEDLEELQKMLEMQKMQEIARIQGEKMAALGQLAGGIAHDFNNQLMSIIGNATMIQRTNDLTKIKEYAERIIYISQSTANLTKKILMFSKNESSNNKPISLKNVMDNAFTMVESLLDKKIELIYKYGASNKMILGDEAQMENLIVNMILNSRDAMENTNGRIELGAVDTVVFSEMVLSHGETLKPGNYITIYVEDNGSGISEDVLMKIFEPYFTTKTKSKGTGLGLSVVFGTVKSHSGFINVKSKVESGTRFEIFLPVYNKKQSSSKNKKVEIKSNLVLLVDDDENVLNVESELIEDLGYDVVKFSKPVEALKYYNENFSKLAFSVIDLSMPVMTGRQLYEEMKKANKNNKSIFITGYAMQADYEELIKQDEVIIQKPFTYEDLSVQIAKIYTQE